jgi:membrane protease YdiL (CAAX protease family)
MIAILYFGFILAVFNKHGRESLQEALAYFPNLALWCWVPLTAVYLLYTKCAGGTEWNSALKVFLYLAIIPLLLWPARNKGDSVTKWDITALLVIWLPFNFHFFGRRFHAIRGALDLQLIAISACILCIVCWVGQRKMSGIKLDFGFRLRDIVIVFSGLLILSAILIPTGVHIGFLVLGDFWKIELQNSSVPEVLWAHLATWKFVWLLFGIALLRAFPEELLFRSLLQNFLEKTSESKWRPLVVTSLIFGASHLDNNAKSLHPADWNWIYAGFATLAGAAYGLVFKYSSSLLYAILLHDFVDALWEALFRT